MQMLIMGKRLLLGGGIIVAGGLFSLFFSNNSFQQFFTSVHASSLETNTKYPQTKDISYTYKLTNSSDKDIEQADFYAYTPLPRTSYQRLEQLDVEVAHELTRDKFGNQIIHFKIDKLPALSSINIIVRAKLALSLQANEIPLNDAKSFLKKRSVLNLNEPQIDYLADKLNRGKPHQVIKNTFLWTMRNIRCKKVQQSEKNQHESLNNQAENCADSVHVFTSLSRRNKIPAREIGGYIIENDHVIQSEAFHHWAEFYANKQWHLVDLKNKVFDQPTANYIAFKLQGNDSKSPLNESHHYKVSDQRIQISMN